MCWDRASTLIRRVVLGAAALLAAVMLGVFAFVLADSQASSRHEAEQRFLAQATIAAGLTKAIFSTINGPQLALATKRFGGARINPRALTELAHSSHLSYVYVTDADGRVLATSRAPALSGVARRGTLSPGITRALAGQPWLSDLVTSRGGNSLIQQTIPFPTRFGRRVEVLAYPAARLSAFLGSYLVGALPDKHRPRPRARWPRANHRELRSRGHDREIPVKPLLGHP